MNATAGEAENRRYLRLREAAERLSISAATLRNWVRLEIVIPDGTKPYRFLPETISAFRLSGISKLTSRANKCRSRARCFRGPWRRAAAAFRSLRPGLDCAMYLAALKRLEAAGEAELDVDAHPVGYRRGSVRTVMEGWERRLSNPFGPRALRFFLALPPMKSEESLGELHQALTSEGSRSARGAYYTPSALVDAALRFGAGARNFLDPCCGSGHYLIRAAKLLLLEPEKIYGIECDPVAAELARINLLLAFPAAEFTPNIFRGNALAGRILREARGSFELVATNPPWGADKSGQEESFTRFLRQALHFLAPGGKLSFLLPEAALNIRTHAPLRKMLLEMCRIETVELLGRCFSGVFTSVVRLDAIKTPPSEEHTFRVVRGGGESLQRQIHAAERDEYAIEAEVTAADRALIEKISRVPHHTLSGYAEWALGIVTGDNLRLLASEPEPDGRPILCGRDILPNRLHPPRRWLRPGKLQQCAPERLYRTAPKIVYRFIADRPVCAVDREGMLTLNSANLLIPQLPGWPVELTARFLNSRLTGYLFRKRFSVCKVLRKDLERLPFPLLSASEIREWLLLEESGFEDRIFLKFGLTQEERELVLSSFQ